MKKKIISIGLSTSMLMGGVALAAGTEKPEVKNNDTVLISEKMDTSVISEKVEKESSYKSYKGKITEVTSESGILSIAVSSEDEKSNKSIAFTIDKEALVLTDKTQGDIKRENIEKGMNVEIFYEKNAPMTKSLPPIVNARVLVVRESKEKLPLGVKVDTFNKTAEEKDYLVSVDNFLRLNITEKTVMVDKDGNKLTEKDLDAKDLVVFYGPATTMSIPAQSNAVKVIVLAEKEKIEEENPEEVATEIKLLDKIALNGEQKNLKNKMYKSGKTVMMPIREVAEILGYKVSWNGKAKQVELSKDSNYLTLTSGQDMYSFAKMIVKLGKASENKNGTVFVPVSFIEEVMQLEMKVTKEGIVNIK